jgi:hypothetical protein
MSFIVAERLSCRSVSPPFFPPCSFASHKPTPERGGDGGCEQNSTTKPGQAAQRRTDRIDCSKAPTEATRETDMLLAIQLPRTTHMPCIRQHRWRLTGGHIACQEQPAALPKARRYTEKHSINSNTLHTKIVWAGGKQPVLVVLPSSGLLVSVQMGKGEYKSGLLPMPTGCATSWGELREELGEPVRRETVVG